MDLTEKIEKIRENLVDEDWISPSSEIRQSGIGGKGLFAIEPIQRDDLVVVWGGTYTDADGAEKVKRNEKLVMQWDTNLFSVENRGEGSGYYINHSCDPNLWMQGPYALVAMRDIKKSGELTADYALWEADEDFVSAWNCNCGSTECRNKITGIDWLLPELQAKYRGHFSPLINKRIEGLKSGQLKINKAYSAGGIVIKKEKGQHLLLLVKLENGLLVFPKGHIEDTETKEEAALREVEEETGLSELEIVKQIGEVVRPSREDSGEAVIKTIYLFLIKADNYEHKEAEESYGWITYDEAIVGLGFKAEKDFLKKHWPELMS